MNVEKSKTVDKYYLVSNRLMPWGDYGTILFSGLLKVMDKDYNPIDVHLIERAVPYIPEIYKVNSTNLVVREDIKNLLVQENITGIKKIHNTEFRKLVHIDWKKWDFEKEPQYPKSGNPYDYIAKRKHNEKLLSLIDSCFFSLKIERNSELQINNEEKFILNKKPLYDVFLPNNMHYIIVSEKFKNLIEKNTNNCLVFSEVMYQS